MMVFNALYGLVGFQIPSFSMEWKETGLMQILQGLTNSSRFYLPEDASLNEDARTSFGIFVGGILDIAPPCLYFSRKVLGFSHFDYLCSGQHTAPYCSLNLGCISRHCRRALFGCMHAWSKANNVAQGLWRLVIFLPRDCVSKTVKENTHLWKKKDCMLELHSRQGNLRYSSKPEE